MKAGHVTANQREQIKRRGCAVIKGHFPREQALGWDSVDAGLSGPQPL
ncbi:YbiU family protein [Escherichia coli]